MQIPQRFNDYRCAEYFASEAFVRDVWDEQSQLWIIVASDDVVERPELEFLVVGRPGSDGIEFGYRKGHDGLWAHYPIGDQFALVAPSIGVLVKEWLAGNIAI